MKTSDQNCNLEFDVDKIDVFVFRTPADPPVQTSFGIMRDRPAVLLRVRDRDGAEGWGEIWCNFPVVGAEHRGRLAATYLPPITCGRRWASPQACMNELTRQFAVLAIQETDAGLASHNILQTLALGSRLLTCRHLLHLSIGRVRPHRS